MTRLDEIENDAINGDAIPTDDVLWVLGQLRNAEASALALSDTLERLQAIKDEVAHDLDWSLNTGNKLRVYVREIEALIIGLRRYRFFIPARKLLEIFSATQLARRYLNEDMPP